MARILVVDDSHLSRRLLSIFLQRENHVISQSENGQEALSVIDEDTFDLIITDIAMPVMDGLAFLDNLRSDVKHKYLPVIVLTASVQDHLSQQAMEKGATRFLTQPFSSWELRKVVTECL
jgi:two-component system response regulator ResD